MFAQSAYPGDVAGTTSAARRSSFQPQQSAIREKTVPGQASPLGIWDLLGMLAGFALVLAITMVNSRGRIFWEDEMLGWLLLRDPSWHHMIRAWNLGADGGGFSFYLLGRAWFRLFGDSALAFRLFSSTCFGLAFAVTWAALRRFYPMGVVAFAAVNSFFFSPPLTMHFLEGRFYGLLVLSTALAIWLVLRLDEARAPLPGRLLLATFLIHGLLTTSHVLGIVYSFFLLGATVVLDRLRGRTRLGLYLTVAASWLLLLPERTSIVAAGRVGKPHFWTTAPTPSVILGAYTGFSHEILLVLALLLLVAVFTLRQAQGGFPAGLLASFHQRRAPYVAALCLLLVPVGFLVEGLAGTWLFTDRYLQPIIIGIAFLTAELALLSAGWAPFSSLRARWPSLAKASLLGAGTLYAAFTLFWDFHHIAQYTPEAPDFTEALTAHLPADLPVVVEDAFTFTGLMSREANSRVQYTYLLDWPYTLSADAPRLEVTQYHLMENWKLAGYFPERIQQIDGFLAQHPRFLVIHNGLIHPVPSVTNEIGNALTLRLQHDPAYQVLPYFTLDRTYHDSVRDTVSLVCRGSCDVADTSAHPDRCLLTAGYKVTCCNGPTCALPEAPVQQLRSIWHLGRREGSAQ